MGRGDILGQFGIFRVGGGTLIIIRGLPIGGLGPGMELLGRLEKLLPSIGLVVFVKVRRVWLFRVLCPLVDWRGLSQQRLGVRIIIDGIDLGYYRVDGVYEWVL